MADTDARSRPSSIKRNRNCPADREINILLLGQTGVGKTTFINSLANYLTHDTLDEAVKDEMQVVIPTSFSFTNPETFEQKTINIDDKNKSENINENGQSSTQQCRSYVFPIGDRNLRLIDTPGMGDTRGSEQDNKNLFEILTYISHYEHLNGICIFLKPNEERLTIPFRLVIRQILHYLHTSASENIIFIFTNARTTFFMPGSSKKLLQAVLNDHHDKNNIEIPFSRDNTFLLDNEPFHCVALHKNGIHIDQQQMESYTKSWDCTVKEYERLFKYIAQRPLHAVSCTLSLNEAEQLIRKLPRPIAETIRFIEQNIQLANDCKQLLLDNQQSTVHTLPQYAGEVRTFQHPALICAGKHCVEIVDIDGQKQIEYSHICKTPSYLNGVVQEAIKDPRIAQCSVINNQTGKPIKSVGNK
jgi:GTPase SAR1 family protein